MTVIRSAGLQPGILIWRASEGDILLVEAKCRAKARRYFRPERDEQRGLMYLFKGIVGLRNFKAHSNTLFDGPNRAHDYLALASLLLHLLEIAKVNPAPLG